MMGLADGPSRWKPPHQLCGLMQQCGPRMLARGQWICFRTYPQILVLTGPTVKMHKRMMSRMSVSRF
ncbi:MAG: hypothetical protein QOC94_4632 [Actinoplanes sp.]|nr:hypothetical protein [Actinoplanes sp.]